MKGKRRKSQSLYKRRKKESIILKKTPIQTLYMFVKLLLLLTFFYIIYILIPLFSKSVTYVNPNNGRFSIGQYNRVILTHI